jgi:hypothetical protein
MNPTDEYEICHENTFITVFIPATSKAFVFRVKSRINRGYERFHYGPLPLTSGTTLPTYEGGSASVPANGVIPARAYTKDGLVFPTTLSVFDENDMWYLPTEDRDRLFHVIQYVTPAFLRIDVQIPTGVTQGRFQKDRVTTGVDKDFGFSRGVYEIVHLPGIRYGYRYGNDTNVPLFTSVKFVYGEYVIEIPRNSSLIFDTIVKRVPSYWITLPINYTDPSITRALTETYGIEGFPVYRQDERDRAIREYESLLGGVKI